MIQRLGDKKPFCTYCLSESHTAWRCGKKAADKGQAYNDLKVSSSFGGQRKPMKRGTKRLQPIGKQGKKTIAFVEAWKRTQKPDSNGMYTCYISGRKVPYLMAEHPYSKARHPELRTNQQLEPVEAEINKLKGSLDIGDFLEKYPEYKATVKKEYLV